MARKDWIHLTNNIEGKESRRDFNKRMHKFDKAIRHATDRTKPSK